MKALISIDSLQFSFSSGFWNFDLLLLLIIFVIICSKSENFEYRFSAFFPLNVWIYFRPLKQLVYFLVVSIWFWRLGSANFLGFIISRSVFYLLEASLHYSQQKFELYVSTFSRILKPFIIFFIVIRLYLYSRSFLHSVWSALFNTFGSMFYFSHTFYFFWNLYVIWQAVGVDEEGVGEGAVVGEAKFFKVQHETD